jgi:ribonuclease BN (tRNA processing enzyme)
MLPALICLGLLAAPASQLVLLGTGTPNADPDRSGPAVAVVVNGQPYLVDFGPGVVRRAAAAARKGVTALAVSNLKTAFATHLHSDHTAGLPDLILTPAVLDRHAPLELYGPKGIKDMARHILAAYRQDLQVRIKGDEKGDPRAYLVNAHEYREGTIYKDANVTVKAFLVKHGEWREAYALRFETPDRTIVISGDTIPNDNIVKACAGCDILLHEVYSVAGFKKRPPQWQTYHSRAHTSSVQLGEIANRAKPKLLVLYHQLLWSSNEQELMKEIGAVYKGEVRFGNDLDVF